MSTPSPHRRETGTTTFTPGRLAPPPPSRRVLRRVPGSLAPAAGALACVRAADEKKFARWRAGRARAFCAPGSSGLRPVERGFFGAGPVSSAAESGRPGGGGGASGARRSRPGAARACWVWCAAGSLGLTVKDGVSWYALSLGKGRQYGGPARDVRP
jgi:hypothetical protein